MYDIFIKRCLELAKNGYKEVHPNPMVGCVIVKNKKIIAEGYHERYGENHAEINALNKITGKCLLRSSSFDSQAKDATLYVNLEPCCHQGKTPACTDRIIKEGIKRVVIGSLDPNPLVRGKGMRLLRDAGIEVISGILEKECKELNYRFYYFMENNLPYVLVKIALSKNLKMTSLSKKSIKITNHYADKIVHKWRSEYDAILVGSGTIISDNPKLTVREVIGRQPYRIILDREKKLDLEKYHVFNDEFKEKTVLISDKQFENSKYTTMLKSRSIQLIEIDNNLKNKLNLKKVLMSLTKINVTSVIIESGIELTKELIKENLYQELAIFIGKSEIEDGITPFKSHTFEELVEELGLDINSVKNIDGDILITKNNNL